MAKLEHAVGNFILRVACNRTFARTLPTIQREPMAHSRGLTKRCLSAPGEEPPQGFLRGFWGFTERLYDDATYVSRDQDKKRLHV